jgi:integrative and conjugative element protein (TIGR02256 family)
MAISLVFISDRRMDPKSDVEFWSKDRRFGLWVGAEQMSRVLQMCGQSVFHETGGILIGHYTESYDLAIVTGISGPPSDSLRGRTWFVRGISGLQQRLGRLWHKNRYYIGEWHYHPDNSAKPSGTDILQMQEISKSVTFSCPEPVLLLIGGNPPEHWEARAYVFPRENAYIELIQARAL